MHCYCDQTNPHVCAWHFHLLIALRKTPPMWIKAQCPKHPFWWCREFEHCPQTSQTSEDTVQMLQFTFCLFHMIMIWYLSNSISRILTWTSNVYVSLQQSWRAFSSVNRSIGPSTVICNLLSCGTLNIEVIGPVVQHTSCRHPIILPHRLRSTAPLSWHLSFIIQSKKQLSEIKCDLHLTRLIREFPTGLDLSWGSRCKGTQPCMQLPIEAFAEYTKQHFGMTLIRPWQTNYSSCGGNAFIWRWLLAHVYWFHCNVYLNGSRKTLH